MNDEVMLFVDLDETLWYTTALHLAHTILPNPRLQEAYLEMDRYQQIEFWEDYGRNIVLLEIFGTYVNALHPQARTFLRRCKSLAPTAILTYGSHDFQDDVWYQHGLNNLGIEIYAFEDYHNLPQSKKSILVDNNPPQYPHCRHKLSALGIGSDRLVQVSGFWGNQDDKSLLFQTLPAVERLLKNDLR